MIFHPWLAACAVTFCAPLVAQSISPSSPKAIHSTPKRAGTYHVATGTWLRPTSDSARMGNTDVIYNNTAYTGQYSTTTDLPNSYQLVQAGRIPSSGSAGTANRDNYLITDIEMGYCIEANAPAAADVLITIYGSYVPCEDPANHPIVGEFLASGLPGANIIYFAMGLPTCWTVNFDLTGGEEICVLGDADGHFSGDLTRDSFGIGLEFDPGGLAGFYASRISLGPMLAGDRLWTVQSSGAILPPSGGTGVPGCPTRITGGGGGTYFGPAECCLPAGGGDNSSGLDTEDLYWINFHPSSIYDPGCYWFGGSVNPAGCNANGGMVSNPPSSSHIKISANQSDNCIPDFKDVTTFCGPGNNNSTGSPAVLTGLLGFSSGSGLHLNVAGGPPALPGSQMLGYFLVGDTNSAPGISISDGQFCLAGPSGGSFGRYNAIGTDRMSLGFFNNAGVLENASRTGGYSGLGFDVPSAIQIAGSPPATILSGDTYHFQCWYRDTAAGAGHSNFSNAVSVVF